MLGEPERDVLNTALEKYRRGQSDPILVGGSNRLKPALRLMNVYRLRIDEIKGNKVITSYTRWLECVQVRGAFRFLFHARPPGKARHTLGLMHAR
jgi:hypothetical protein